MWFFTAVPTGFTGRSEVTLIDTGLVLSPLWPFVLLEWDRGTSGFLLPGRFIFKKLTLCVTFPHMHVQPVLAQKHHGGAPWDGGRFGGNDFFSTSWFDDEQCELS